MRKLKTRLSIIVASTIMLSGFLAVVIRHEIAKRVAKEDAQKNEYLAYKEQMDQFREEQRVAIESQRAAAKTEMATEKIRYEELLATQKQEVAAHTRQIPQTYVAMVGAGTTSTTKPSSKSSSASVKTTASSTTAKPSTTTTVTSTPAATPKPAATTKAS